MEGEFFADYVGVVATIGEQCPGLVCDHAEEWAEALHIMRLSRRHDEAERPAFPVAAGMELVVKPPRDRPSASVASVPFLCRLRSDAPGR